MTFPVKSGMSDCTPQLADIVKLTPFADPIFLGDPVNMAFCNSHPFANGFSIQPNLTIGIRHGNGNQSQGCPFRFTLSAMEDVQWIIAIDGEQISTNPAFLNFGRASNLSSLLNKLPSRCHSLRMKLSKFLSKVANPFLSS
jgi:hypothetical protein